jgi:acyl-CoA dehydrogenase
MKFRAYEQGEGLNWWTTDPNLRATVARSCSPEAMAWAEPYLARFGELCGTRVAPRADYTDTVAGRPRLQAYNRQGQEISHVIYNPGYLQTVADVYGSGIVAWRHVTPEGAPGPVPPAVTWAMGYMVSMAETGFYCPVCLTGSAAHALARYAPVGIKERYLSRLITIDPTLLMQGATWLTEKTGGSDVGAITTVAVPAGPDAKLPSLTEATDGDGVSQTIPRSTTLPPGPYIPGSVWRLTGEKWFASNADADVALALARPEGAPAGTAGLALFLVPRFLPDGGRNAHRIRRLKEKLGVIAVPSGEVLLEGAEAYLIGGPGVGFKMMMEAINLSRIYNIIGSAGICRRAFLESIIYTSKRTAFGRPLTDQPLMRLKLTQMLVETEAATTLAFRAADCYEQGRPFHRMLIPVAKARTADQALRMARAGIECFGGNGYIEEYPMARIMRDAQVLTVWEGPENVLALDLLRVLAKSGPGDFVQEAEAALGTVTGERLTPLRQVLAGELARFTDQLLSLAAADPIDAQVGALRILHGMADLLTAVYLLAEAEGNPHKERIAALYAERFQPNPALWDRAAVDWFDQLMAEA